MRKGGGQALSDEDFADVERKRNELIQVHGVAFGKPYGWAAEALQSKGPKLMDILRAATTGIDPIYREASLWVHSSTVGVFANAQSFGNAMQFVTTANDDRLSTQIRGTALGLVFTTANLLALAPKDKSLRARCMAILRLGQLVAEKASAADTRWLRRHPTYRILPPETVG